MNGKIERGKKKHKVISVAANAKIQHCKDFGLAKQRLVKIHREPSTWSTFASTYVSYTCVLLKQMNSVNVE